jgi:hypothetical protein
MASCAAMSERPIGRAGADVLLSACLGAPVVRGARRVAELADVATAPGSPTPAVTGVVVARRGDPPAWVAWREVARVDRDRVTLAPEAALAPVPTAVLLARDVLDAQLVDLAGQRVVRVGDVRLRADGDELRVVGVEAGLDSVLRRLGLARMARRAPRHAIAWSDLHLPAHPGAALSIDRAGPALERLSGAERARLASRLPAHVAAALLRPARHLVPHRFPTHVLRRRRAAR